MPVEERGGELTPQEGMRRPEGVKAILDFGLWILDEKRSELCFSTTVMLFYLRGVSVAQRLTGPGSGGRRHGGIDEMLMHCEPCRP